MKANTYTTPLRFVVGPDLDAKVEAFRSSLPKGVYHDLTRSSADDRVFVSSVTERAWLSYLASQPAVLPLPLKTDNA
jgi:hypothetical protein